MTETMDYNFTVSKKPIRFVADTIEDGQIITRKVPDKMAIVREDTNQVLSIVSNKYNITQHSEIINTFDQIDSIERQKVKISDDGGIMFALYKIKNKPLVEVDVGDMVEFKIRAFNSHNFSTGRGFELIGHRLVCKNGMTVPKTLAGISFKHMNNEGLRGIESTIEKCGMNLSDVVCTWRSWSKKHIDKDKAETFFRSLNLHYEVEERLIDKISDQKNMWELYNLLTKYTTHEMINRGKNKLANQRKKEQEYSEKFYKYSW